MIEFFFDCSSPWTYLAFHNIQPMAAQLGFTIAWRPILVGGVFNTVNPSVYASRDNPVPAKAAYMRKDLDDWARAAGLKIVFPPRVFPVNSVKAMRGCILLEAEHKLVPFARAAFETYWGDDQDISQDDVLARRVRTRRRRSGILFRRHRRAGDQGPAARQHRGVDPSRRLRLADNVHRRHRHVFRQ